MPTVEENQRPVGVLELKELIRLFEYFSDSNQHLISNAQFNRSMQCGTGMANMANPDRCASKHFGQFNLHFHIQFTFFN
jgi:hypothetical protein